MAWCVLYPPIRWGETFFDEQRGGFFPSGAVSEYAFLNDEPFRDCFAGARQAAEESKVPRSIVKYIPPRLKPASIQSTYRHESTRALSKPLWGRVFPQGRLSAFHAVIVRRDDLPCSAALQPCIGPNLTYLCVGLGLVFADGMFAAIDEGEVV
jgi:hypothetical protein